MKAHTALCAALSLTVAAASIPAAPGDTNWPSFRGVKQTRCDVVWKERARCS